MKNIVLSNAKKTPANLITKPDATGQSLGHRVPMLLAYLHVTSTLSYTGEEESYSLPMLPGLDKPLEIRNFPNAISDLIMCISTQSLR